MPDREDFEKLLREKLSRRTEERRPTLQRQQQAAVAMDNLTGSPEWDYFLSLVQGLLEEAQSRLEDAERVLLGPECGYEMLMSAKAAFAEARGQVAAYEHALALPKRLREEGTAAREELRAKEKLDVA